MLSLTAALLVTLVVSLLGFLSTKNKQHESVAFLFFAAAVAGIIITL